MCYVFVWNDKQDKISRKTSNKNKPKMKSSDDGFDAGFDLRNNESGDDNNEHLSMHLKKGDINSNEYNGEDEINIRGEESDNITKIFLVTNFLRY